MGSVFQLHTKRIVNQCGHHYYLHPEVHKNRIIFTHDILYLAKGKWELYQNGTSYLLEPGDLIIFHSRQHHYGINPCPLETEAFYFHMFPTPGDYYTGDKLDLPNYTDTLVHCQKHPDIREIFDKISMYYWKNTDIGRAEVSALCNLLICRLCEISSGADAKHDEILEEAVQYIHMHPDRFVQMSELAKMLYISEKTLRKRFLGTYSKTPHAYQMDLKLAQAKQILQHNPETLLYEIAQNLGFYDEFHFSKCFKKKFGISPSEYRRQNKNDMTDIYMYKTEPARLGERP